MEPIELTVASLDPRHVYLLHTERTIWLWKGVKSSVSGDAHILFKYANIFRILLQAKFAFLPKS